MSNVLLKEYFNHLSTHNIDTWSEIHEFIASEQLLDDFLNKPAIKGYIVEFIAAMAMDGILYKDIPAEMRAKYDLPQFDCGIDLLVIAGNYRKFVNNTAYPELLDTDMIGVQVKWRRCVIANVYLGNFVMCLLGSELKAGLVFTNVRSGDINIDKLLRKDRCPPINWFRALDKIDYTALFNKIDAHFTKYFEQQVVLYKNPQLWNHQIECLQKMRKCCYKRYKITMCCGAGKTVVFIEHIKHCIEKNPHMQILVIAPTIILINQIYNRLKYNVPNYPIYKYNDMPINIHESEDGFILVSTYDSCDKFSGMFFGLCILDEAHHCMESNTVYGAALNDDNIWTNRRIFFTATERVYNGVKKNKDDIKDMTDELLYGKTLYNYGFVDAIRDKHVVDFKLVLYKSCTGNRKIVEEKYLYKTDFKKELVKVDDVIVSLMIIEMIKAGECRKILTYHNSIVNATEFRRTLIYIMSLCDMKFNCLTMCKDTKKYVRKQLLDDFERAEIAVLSSCKILGEGIDIPCVDGVAFVDKCASYINIAQKIGRGLRVHPGKRECKVIIPANEEDHKYDRFIEIIKAIKMSNKRLYSNYITKTGTIGVKRLKLDDCMISNKLDTIKCIMKTITCKLVTISAFDQNLNEVKEWCDVHPGMTPKYDEFHNNVNIGNKWYRIKYSKSLTLEEKLEKLKEYPQLIRNMKQYYIDAIKRKKEDSTWRQHQVLWFLNEKKRVPKSGDKIPRDDGGKLYDIYSYYNNRAEVGEYNIDIFKEKHKILADSEIIVKNIIEKIKKHKFDQKHNVAFKANLIKKLIKPHMTSETEIRKTLKKFRMDKSMCTKECTCSGHDFKLCSFYDERKKHRYIKKLESIEDNILWGNKNLEDRIIAAIENRENNKDVETYTTQEKHEACDKFANKHKRAPNLNTDEYMIRGNMVNIGLWYNRRRSKIKTLNDLNKSPFSKNKYIDQNIRTLFAERVTTRSETWVVDQIDIFTKSRGRVPIQNGEFITINDIKYDIGKLYRTFKHGKFIDVHNGYLPQNHKLYLNKIVWNDLSQFYALSKNKNKK